MMQLAEGKSTSERAVRIVANPDLEVLAGHLPRWNHADNRRRSFHRLPDIARYGLTLRADHVMLLTKSVDLRIADLDDVNAITTRPSFSALVVVRDQEILFERYAPDFRPDMVHSIQSITKTTMNLVIGRLVDDRKVDLFAPVARYIPEIGSGYARATVQEVLDMDVVNEYSEDFSDPNSTYFRHEEAMGWRLPARAQREPMEHDFLTQIQGDGGRNCTGHAQYKDANTAILGWVAERASGKQLRMFLADIVDAAGLEAGLYITTDRNGVPAVEGGACMTARDLARYMALFPRLGVGVARQIVGGDTFIRDTLRGGLPMRQPLQAYRYRNHAMISNNLLGHGGWGGQLALVNMVTGTVAIYLSVAETADAQLGNSVHAVIRALETICGFSSAS
jgi:CubicO group peptidase (beta-lactamase class C family)